MSKIHKLLSRQLRRYRIEENALSTELIESISSTYLDFENREEKLNSIIEVNDKELTQKNKQVHEILESLPSFVLWVDHHLTYLGMNKNLEDLLGVDKNELTGKKVQMIFNHEHNEFIKFLEKFKNSNLESDQFDYSAEYNSGEKYFNVYLQKISDDNKIIINSIDVTDKIQLQKKLTAEAATQSHKDRLILLGELAAGVAHEINNPMTVILGQGTAILRRCNQEVNSVITEETKELIDRAEKIVKMSKRVSRIVQSLKLLSRDADNDDYHDENIDTIFNSALDLSTDKLKFHNIELRFNKSEDVVLKCKAGELTQIFYNLINNSIDAIKDLEEKWIEVSINRTKEYSEIKITDSGIGVPLDIQEKLFLPFFTTKPVGQGTGLGLSISKKIIENHHGKISIDNTCPNTCFVIQFSHYALENDIKQKTLKAS